MAPRGVPRSRWAPLSVGRFRALWSGALLSWYGDFLALPALLIISYRLGGELGVGAMVFLQTAPLVALLPIGGALGDRGDRRRRLIALDLVRASFAGLMIVGASSGSLVLVLAAFAASRSAAALYDPGRRRLLPLILPASLVPAGGSLLAAVGESSILLGPALGAVMLLAISPQFLLLVDGATFLASAALLSRVGPQPSVAAPEPYLKPGPWSTIRRGFGYLWLDGTVRIYALQAALSTMLAAVITVYFVPIVHDVLRLGTNQVGVMYIVVGAASLGGSALAVRTPKVGSRSLITLGYISIVAAVLVGTSLGPVAVVGGLLIFAGAGALQEAWGLNRIQTTTQRDGVGQALGSALWLQYAGRAVGAAVGAWGALHLGRQDLLALLVAGAVGITLLLSTFGGLRIGRNVGSWPPGGPPLPLEP